MKDVPVTGVLSIVVGLIILLIPHLLPYLIGVYLVVIGILTITKKS